VNTITLPQRSVPVVGRYDVVVAGGGPGGFPAAVAAARYGAKVLIVERHGYLGGLATAGLVMPILAHTAHESHRPIVEGILKEMTERMHASAERQPGSRPARNGACASIRRR
jgi:flavin-dependent dehydrogenase